MLRKQERLCVARATLLLFPVTLLAPAPIVCLLFVRLARALSSSPHTPLLVMFTAYRNCVYATNGGFFDISTGGCDGYVLTNSTEICAGNPRTSMVRTALNTAYLPLSSSLSLSLSLQVATCLGFYSGISSLHKGYVVELRFAVLTLSSAVQPMASRLGGLYRRDDQRGLPEAHAYGVPHSATGSRLARTQRVRPRRRCCGVGRGLKWLCGCATQAPNTVTRLFYVLHI